MLHAPRQNGGISHQQMVPLLEVALLTCVEAHREHNKVLINMVTRPHSALLQLPEVMWWSDDETWPLLFWDLCAGHRRGDFSTWNLCMYLTCCVPPQKKKTQTKTDDQMGGGESDSMQPVWRTPLCCIMAKWHRRSFVSLLSRRLEPRDTVPERRTHFLTNY